MACNCNKTTPAELQELLSWGPFGQLAHDLVAAYSIGIRDAVAHLVNALEDKPWRVEHGV